MRSAQPPRWMKVRLPTRKGISIVPHRWIGPLSLFWFNRVQKPVRFTNWGDAADIRLGHWCLMLYWPSLWRRLGDGSVRSKQGRVK